MSDGGASKSGHEGAAYRWLTTPHKLQGRGALGKPVRSTSRVELPPRKPMAAP